MYTATEFSSIEDKYKFEKQFKRFVESGFKRTLFPKWFYTRLSMMFGHIAHYNIYGFYQYWFSDIEKQQHFINNCLQWRCYGDPAFTYSDVERELKDWIQRNGIDTLINTLANDEFGAKYYKNSFIQYTYDGGHGYAFFTRDNSEPLLWFYDYKQAKKIATNFNLMFLARA